MLIYIGLGVLDADSVEYVGPADKPGFCVAVTKDGQEYGADMPWRDMAELVQGAPYVELQEGLLVARKEIVSVEHAGDDRTLVTLSNDTAHLIDIPYTETKKLVGARVVASQAALAYHEHNRGDE